MTAAHQPSFRLGLLALIAGTLVALLVPATSAEAIPVWARKYQTSCSTCHAPFPKLNYFGKAFRNNGYRFPGGEDGTARKEPPVSLGAEGYKKLFPRALWPSDIPGTVPVAVRGVSRLTTAEGEENSTFEFPHEFEVLAGGTLGESFSFFGEIEIENEANENELGMDVVLQYDPRPWLHVRMGGVNVHPIGDGLRLTAAHYTPYDTRATPGSLTLRPPNPNGSTPTVSITATTGEDRWRFREGQPGIEVWGAHNGPKDKGGVTWALGIANGQGVIDANENKDVYARVAYKFGGYGELGGSELSQDLEYWRDDSFKVGVFTYVGKSMNVFEGSTLALSGSPGAGIVTVSANQEIENTFNIVGMEFDWWLRDLNVFGLALRQHDDNPRGTGETIDTNSWFVEADYTVYPWLVGIVQYGVRAQDFSIRADPVTQKFLVPAVVFVARANIKFTLEGQARLDNPGKGHNRLVVAIDFGF